jgi:GAF domain-containing protein
MSTKVHMTGQAWAAAPVEAAALGESIESTLRAARELLGMDIAWIAEFQDGKKIFRAVEGDGESFGFSDGGSMPLDGSYCQRVVLGSLPNAIPDTSLEPGVRDLEVTETARIGAYLGVPIERADGTVYGTLCCASHRPNGGLSEQDVEFLRGISKRVAAAIEDRTIS